MKDSAQSRRRLVQSRIGYKLRSGTTGQGSKAQDSHVSSNVPLVDNTHTEEENILPIIAENNEEPQDDEILASPSHDISLIPKPLDHAPIFGKDIQVRILEEVIEKFIVKRSVEPPRIPLCRLMENEAIRAVGPGVDILEKKFESSGYSVLGAPFIVSLRKPGHDQQFITANDIEEWGPVWGEVNKDFERNLPKEWDDLRGKKILVWDGNHRLKTWMRIIKNQYSTIKWRHCSVKCHFVSLDRSSEGEFMLALRAQNEIGRTTICTNFGQELFLFQKLAMASKESLVKDFPKEWLHWIEVELSYEKKATKVTWYNAPALLLAMLVWKEEFDATLATERQEINDPALGEAEIELLARGRTEKTFKERAYKMLSIVNPANGQGFFSLLFKYNWIKDKDLVGLTKDKIHSLATSKINSGRKRDILHSMLNCRVDNPASERYLSALKFRLYLRKEWYWENILKQCLKIKGKLICDLPDGFEVWFSHKRDDHLDKCFFELWNRLNTKESNEKIPELLESSKRVLYRWIISLYDQHKLDDMPQFVEEWKDFQGSGSMFSSSIKERELSEWEMKYCPWWLDYPLGSCPREEELHYKDHVGEDHNMVDTSNVVGSASKNPSSSKRKRTPKQQTTNVSEPTRSSLNTRLESMHTKEVIKQWPRPKKKTKIDTFIKAAFFDILQVHVNEEECICSFLSSLKLLPMLKDGEESNECTSLFFADFPTNYLVENLSMEKVPEWNIFSSKMSKRVANLASRYVADDGWYITLSSPDHFGTICGHALSAGFKLMQTIVLLIPEGYVQKKSLERVETLLLGLFYYKGNLPIYDRKNGETVDSKAFDAQSGVLMEKNEGDFVDKKCLRGVAERSLNFYRWLLKTFTQEHAVVVDIFAGNGGMAMICGEEHRHCICLENDEEVFSKHLEKFGEMSSRSEAEIDWGPYEPEPELQCTT